VSRAADALTNLGAFCSAASDGVEAEATRLDRCWDGQAAQAALEYFTGLSSALWQMKPHFDNIADQFQTTAFGVKELANAAGSLVENLADWAIVAGVSLAAGVLSSWTGVGAAVSATAASYAIFRGAISVNEAIEAIEDWEFSTRLGADKDDARQLRAELGGLITRLGPWE
jgi:hypothetical protein